MKRICYFVMYYDDEGRECYSEEYTSVGNAYRQSKSLRGTLYIRIDEPFDIEKYKEQLERKLAEATSELIALK